jgi:hypothetical protein
MHLLIPFASALSTGAKQALHELKLPHLAQLLAWMAPTARFGLDEYTLTPPHERALAEHLGWQGDDGCLPWAARQAVLDGIDVGQRAWGLLTPVHWHVGSDHISLADPRLLRLTARESSELFEAIKPLFVSEGWTALWGGAERWYVAHDSLDGLPCASLDRVIGRNIDTWMPEHPQAKLVRRLQNEVQMLLYQQPVNDERVGMGALPVNSFWLSGCGRAQATPRGATELQLDARLTAPMLAENPVAWVTAWHELDAGPIAEGLDRLKKGLPFRLTLCGERFAQRFEPRTSGLVGRLTRAWARTPPRPVLEAL